MIEEKLEQFDRFIDKLPERVNETPRDVLKQFIKSVLEEVQEEAIKEYKETLVEKLSQMKPPKNYKNPIHNTGYMNALDDILKELS